MNERPIGQGLTALAFGLGAKRPTKPDIDQILTPSQPKGARASKVKAQTSGLGGCSCTRRKVQ